MLCSKIHWKGLNCVGVESMEVVDCFVFYHPGDGGFVHLDGEDLLESTMGARSMLPDGFHPYNKKLHFSLEFPLDLGMMDDLCSSTR